MDQEELDQRIEYMWSLAESNGLDLADNEEALFHTLALQGKSDQAVDIALEHLFNEPVLLNLEWEETLKQAQYADIVEDPRVQAAMKKWQDEEDELREQIRGWLADLQASS